MLVLTTNKSMVYILSHMHLKRAHYFPLTSCVLFALFFTITSHSVRSKKVFNRKKGKACFRLSAGSLTPNI